ncbi:MAG: HU family DNA-binding protein [Rubrobacteraceae bacterium]
MASQAQEARKMNKTDLIQKIADETGGSKSDAQKHFDAFTEVVKDALKTGDDVQITGFGKFYVQRREARQGINPQTKQKMNIPASKVPKFTAGNALKDSIK